MIQKTGGKYYYSMEAWSKMIEKKLNEVIDVVNELKAARDAEKKIEEKSW